MFSHLSVQKLLSKPEDPGDQVHVELVQALLVKEQEAVIPLRDILQDDQYWEAKGNKKWMLLQAMKLLGTFADHLSKAGPQVKSET